MLQPNTLDAKKLELGSTVISNHWESFLNELFSNEKKISFLPFDSALENKKGTPEKFYLGTLHDDRLRLIQPVSVELFEEHEYRVAVCVSLNEYGYGNTPFEAVDDLCQALTELYWTLKSEQNNLGSSLKVLWDIIQSIIQER